jgi:C-terminal processing protease CtpA/Prc
MRAAFGLAGLLVAVGVIVWLMSINHPADTARAGKKAEEQAQQFAGVGARESIRVEPRERGGRLYALHVNYLVKGGPLEKHYGLKRDDLIVRIGPLDVKEMDSVRDGMDWLVQAYQTNRELTIMREGQQVVLEAGSGKGAEPVEEGPKRSTPQGQAEDLKRKLGQGIPMH